MSAPAASKPKSVLARHRLLAPTASVLVSPICLGAMNFGDAMKDILGECNKETTFEILDYFHSQGGNFIDTANGYQMGESETWLGEWMQKTGRRDEMVIATKYTSGYRLAEGQKIIQSNFGGTGSKSMHLSVEASLKKLQTSYIDLLYVHFWDMQTQIPEVMQSLNHLVSSGKVLYLGISDTPAWVVVKANCYARSHGLRQFSVYQGRWSAAERDMERDVIPMCRDEGMGIAPWGALGGGQFKPASQLGKDGGRNMQGYGTGRDDKVSQVLEKVAGRKGSVVTSVALAYVMHKAPYVFPICGGRKVEHLKGNIEALKLRLSQEDIEEIEGAYEWDPGFPHAFLGGMGGKKMAHGPGDVGFTKRLGHFDYVDNVKPIMPHEE
ncbi:MAG: hypothetical protein MMC23_004812 [Stictis urceolatum]|nr:hypothetical protein [Stictis urceolata]